MKSNIKPLVSILTPAWNRSAYLEKVWAGLDAQVYSEIEWIVANDGSTDDTAKVCLELKRKSRFPVTIIEANLRVGKPRMDNELIKAAKSDRNLIVWLTQWVTRRFSIQRDQFWILQKLANSGK